MMQVFLIGCGRSQGNHVLVVLYVEVKLVHRIDFSDASGSFVALERLDLGSPERVYLMPVLKVAADPRSVVLFTLLDPRVHGVVHQDESRALGDQCIHFFPA